MKYFLLLLLFPVVSYGQWNATGNSTSTGSVTIEGTFTSKHNYGLYLAPPSGDAIIKRTTSGDLFLSSGAGSSAVRFNYNYGGGSGGILIFDGGVTNNAKFSVNGSGHLNISPSGGKVAIGTAPPTDQFEIIDGYRKVGFNAAIPGVTNGGMISISRGDDGSKTMHIGSSAYPQDDNVIFSQGGSTELRFVSNGGAGPTGGFSFYANVSQQNAFASTRPLSPVMKITGDGNVGIGTTTPDHKLTVDGGVKCEEVKVEIFQGTGPDYVFEPDYNLLPLSELETYITQNKHLPEVPSAKEMEKEGLNLKEMNLLLLRKIEELTLHLIEQNKTIADLKENTSSPDLLVKKVEELTLHLIDANHKINRQQKQLDAQHEEIQILKSKKE